MFQPLPFAELKFDNTVNLEEIPNRKINSDIRYALEVILKNTEFSKKNDFIVLFPFKSINY